MYNIVNLPAQNLNDVFIYFLLFPSPPREMVASLVTMSTMSTAITEARPPPLTSPSVRSMSHPFLSMCRLSLLHSRYMPKIVRIRTPTCTSSPLSPRTLTSTMPMCHACLPWPAEGNTALKQIGPQEAGCLPWVPTSTSGVMQNHSKSLILRGERTSLELSIAWHEYECRVYRSSK